MKDDITVLRNKDTLYRLIISQLLYDGHQVIAHNLQLQMGYPEPIVPTNRLVEWFDNLWKPEPSAESKSSSTSAPVKEEQRSEDSKSPKNEEETSTEEKAAGEQPRAVSPSVVFNFNSVQDDDVSDRVLDFDYPVDTAVLAPEPALYECCFSTIHKAPCRAAAFHPNGLLVATGSEDASIKILDVDRMVAKATAPGDRDQHTDGVQTGGGGGGGATQPQQMETHPVIRTLYDHVLEVTCVDFHPFIQILVSGSSDYYLKLYDYSRPSVKKAFKAVREASELRVASFHPSGDYLLVGTQHPTVRLYDVTTMQCFVSADPADQHKGPITCLKYNPTGSMFVSSSKDGDIAVWDGVSNRRVLHFEKAHQGEHVCSAYFSKNGKYVLSAGKDSIVQLWDLRAARLMLAYTGAGALGRPEHRIQAVFNHTEDFVLFPDEKTGSMCSWDARTTQRQRLLHLGHNAICRAISHSPTMPAFVTTGEDARVRFWFRKTITD